MRKTRLFLLVLAGFLAFSCEEIDPMPEPDEPIDIPDPEPEPEPGIEYDGLVKQLRTATNGKGLDIVIMADGFVEADHESGEYDKVMETACKHLFSVEPVASLESYFNVYSVGVVSVDSKLDGTSGLKCNGVYPGPSSNSLVERYAKKVDGIKVDSTVMCIIINSHDFGGWTEFKSYSSQMAYAYSPMIKASRPGAENYRLCVVHETIGHGFAKFMDEYVASGYEKTSPSEKDKQSEAGYQKKGYDRNISFTNDPEKCPWKMFLEDERYADEQFGFYEGVGFYGKNAWRSTKSSLMNETVDKNSKFNAFQRWLIYEMIMHRGEGRVPTYEEFVQFDKNNI